MVQQLQHVMVISDSAIVIPIRLLAWELIEHGDEQQVESAVTLNHALELLDNRVEVSRVVVDMFDSVFKPFLLGVITPWKPSIRSSKLSATLIIALNMPNQTCAYDALSLF